MKTPKYYNCVCSNVVGKTGYAPSVAYRMHLPPKTRLSCRGMSVRRSSTGAQRAPAVRGAAPRSAAAEPLRQYVYGGANKRHRLASL